MVKNVFSYDVFEEMVYKKVVKSNFGRGVGPNLSSILLTFAHFHGRGRRFESERVPRPAV